MIARIFLALIVAVATITFSTANVEAQCASCESGCTACQDNCCDTCGVTGCRGCRGLVVRPLRMPGRFVNCPECECEVCELKVSSGKEEKKCFVVKCETICIPKVQLPWGFSCNPLCAKTKKVRKLSTKKYECPKCSYKWEVKNVCEAPVVTEKK